MMETHLWKRVNKRVNKDKSVFQKQTLLNYCPVMPRVRTNFV
jgi:hypothetical protein